MNNTNFSCDKHMVLLLVVVLVLIVVVVEVLRKRVYNAVYQRHLLPTNYACTCYFSGPLGHEPVSRMATEL